MKSLLEKTLMIALFIGMIAILVSYLKALYYTDCTVRNTLKMSDLPGSCDPEWSADAKICPNCFRPNFDFPRTPPEPEALPWDGIDFTQKANAEEFLFALLNYSLDGFDDHNRTRWDVFNNSVRRWYHAPWLHPHDHNGHGDTILREPFPAPKGFAVRTGREHLLGLTEELTSSPHLLGKRQTDSRTNWAVSFYNATAAHTLWNVWGDGATSPQIDVAFTQFAPGSVFAKPLYTTATPTEVPLLVGAPTALANVSTRPFEVWRRKPSQVRLLQYDVAVKIDPEVFSKYTGLSDTFTWVYGTFIYDGRNSNESDPWKKLQPIGLSWGSDPELEDCSNDTPKQSIVLLNVTDLGIEVGDTTAKDYGRAAKKPCNEAEFGREGRMNGPVDNPISSCHSCHAAAQYRRNNLSSKDNTYRWPWPKSWKKCDDSKSDCSNAVEEFWQRDRCLFLNRNPHRALGDNIRDQPKDCFINSDSYVSTDTSLQVSFGLTNFCKYLMHQISSTEDTYALAQKALACDEAFDEFMASPSATHTFSASNDQFDFDAFRKKAGTIGRRIPPTPAGKGGATF